MRALDGIKVLELSHYIAGPFACQQLANLGADVVKVEPEAGEPGRRAPPFNVDGESLYFATFNHNKRTLGLDLRSADGAQTLPALIRWCDVLVTNFAVGVPERLKFDYATVKAINPRAIMIHITGFGSWSAIGEFPAFDPVIQAMSGLADMVGEPAGPPYVSNVLFGDLITAHQATQAALAALHLRERTGEGTFVEVSMMRSLAPLLGDYVVQACALGDRPTRVGNRQKRRFINAFATTDGYVVIAPITPDQWTAFCATIGRPEWGAGEVTSTRINVTDETLRRDLEGSTQAWMRARTSDEAAAQLRAAGVPCGPVWSIADIPAASEKFNLRMLSQAQLVNGSEVTIPGLAFDVGTPAPRGAGNRVPGLDEHAADIRRDIGLG